MIFNERAYAKVNLTLSVLARRRDGLHEVSSLVVFAELADRVRIRLDEDKSLTLSGAFIEEVPQGPDNLAMQALDFMGRSAKIELEKNIPSKSGLGGGSADAAAILRIISRSGQKVPPDLLSLGADVGACFLSSPLWMQGAGEKIATLARLPIFWCVLINPRVYFSASTKEIFAHWDRRGKTTAHPKPPRFKDFADMVSFCKSGANDLEPLVAQSAGLLERLRHQGAALARMSGAGTSCFGLFANASAARKAAEALSKEKDLWVWHGRIREH